MSSESRTVVQGLVQIRLIGNQNIPTDNSPPLRGCGGAQRFLALVFHLLLHLHGLLLPGGRHIYCVVQQQDTYIQYPYTSIFIHTYPYISINIHYPYPYISMYPCIHVSMYLCIYVSMYLCIYVSMYLCIFVYLYPCIPVSMYSCNFHIWRSPNEKFTQILQSKSS